MARDYTSLLRLSSAILGLLLAACQLSLGADEPKWIRASSSHFTVLTDAGEKKGTEIILRFEQMRAICGQLLLKTKLRMPKPLDIIALKTYSEYAQIAPPRQSQPVSAQGFLLSSGDRNYVVLNLADEESWLAVTHDLAHLYLSYNYPPTQPWFDEGLALYFSSLRVDDRQAEIGADPAGFTSMLGSTAWLPLPQLFAASYDLAKETSHHKMFQAESWIVMHYLLTQNKLAETGTYFDLVQNQKLPLEQAVQKAFGLSAEQLQQAIKAYFGSLSAASAGTGSSPRGARQFPLPLGPTEVGSSTEQLREPQARALICEAKLRVPDHREEALGQLDRLASDPVTETAAAHRGLGLAHFEKREYEQATEEFNKALELEQNDVWTHYYLAAMKFHMAQSNGNLFPGLANMMQDLRIVIDWSPDFAEAYHMLAMARVEGGGVHSALEAIQSAIKLSPRDQSYVLDLARVYMAGKKWDSAQGLLEQLEDSRDPQIAGAAKQSLADLPTLKKYGLLPQRTPAVAPDTRKAQKAGEDEAETREENQPVAAPPDKRAIQFVRGKLLAIDCSQFPAAVLTVSAAGKKRTLKLRTENYKSLLLIGEDQFSCQWSSRAVLAHYKAGGEGGWRSGVA